MDVELPNGTVIEGVPDGWNKAQLTNYLVSKGKGSMLASPEDVAMADPSKGGLPFRPLGINTGITMPEGVSNFTAGGGKAGYDLARGAGQMAGMVSNQDVAQSRAQDAPLMKTGAGMAGNVVGNIAALAPTAFIPGANTYIGAALMGAGAGALSPTVEGESRLLNARNGAALGMAGQGVGNVLGRVIRPVNNSLTPAEQNLASVAARENIPLRAGQATGSRPLQLAESVMENLPLTSASQLAGKRAQQEAYNRAVLAKAGIAADTANPAVLVAQKANVGGQLGDIAERNTLNFSAPVLPKSGSYAPGSVVDRLSDIVDDAGKHLPSATTGQIAGYVDQILAQVGKTGEMSGTNYQGWREPLRALAKKGDETSRYYGQIRSTLDDAFKAQLQGADATAFRDLSRQYGNVKTIAQAMGGAGAGTKIGNISPAQLEAALTQSIGKEGKALGRGDLNELVGVGRKFVSEQLPDSFSAQRLAMQSLLTGGAPLAGGVYGVLTGQNPVETAAYGAALGLGGLASPRLAQALMNTKTGQAYLTKGMANLTPAGRERLSAALRTYAVAKR
jgi:hypothetical protein